MISDYVPNTGANMPSLMQCVIGELEDAGTENQVDPEELVAHYDIDAMAVSEVPGSWEPVNVGNDRSRPRVEGLISDDFTDEGPSVYEANSYMIVRGREEAHSVYFVYERTV